MFVSDLVKKCATVLAKAADAAAVATANAAAATAATAASNSNSNSNSNLNSANIASANYANDELDSQHCRLLYYKRATSNSNSELNPNSSQNAAASLSADCCAASSSSPAHTTHSPHTRQATTTATTATTTTAANNNSTTLLEALLAKAPLERSEDEVDAIFGELQTLRALSHLSNGVRLELAKLVTGERWPRADSLVFKQGDTGQCWYIILAGAVDVLVAGKGRVGSLQAGDDFGKLALVNDSPRAATIVTRAPNVSLLRVDKRLFNRVLRDVEANTIRLHEHGREVLVLLSLGIDAARRVTRQTSVGGPASDTLRASDDDDDCSSDLSARHFKYVVVAGSGAKILEHLIETRLSGDSKTQLGRAALRRALRAPRLATSTSCALPAQAQRSQHCDTLLEDFILTHTIFMPTAAVCGELLRQFACSEPSGDFDVATINVTPAKRTANARNDELAAKLYLVARRRKIVKFVKIWLLIKGEKFLESAAVRRFAAKLLALVEADLIEFECLASEADTVRAIVELLDERPCDSSNATNCIHDSHAPKGQQNQNCDSARNKPSLADVGRRLSLDSAIEFKAPPPTTTQLTNSSLKQAGALFQCWPDDFATSDVALALSELGWRLARQVHEAELVDSVIGSCDSVEDLSALSGDIAGAITRRPAAKLDALLAHFNQIQFWVVTQICLSSSLARRAEMLRKLIKLAAHCKTLNNLNALFAIVLGLSNVAVSRLGQTWHKLPGKVRRLFESFESLLDPTRNHRKYRLLVASLEPPIVPFVPLMLKDLTFAHEGNQTFVDAQIALVNFEKMQIIAQNLRTLRHCKSREFCLEPAALKFKSRLPAIRRYVASLACIECQQTLMRLSQQLE